MKKTCETTEALENRLNQIHSDLAEPTMDAVDRLNVIRTLRNQLESCLPDRAIVKDTANESMVERVRDIAHAMDTMICDMRKSMEGISAAAGSIYDLLEEE